MCGIIGLATVSDQRSQNPEARVQEALRVIRHRGPDDQGLYNDRNFWLGHARLSVLDLSSAGHQPMKSACGRFVIAYNGEVYNYRELAANYGITDLRSASDTEVVLQLFAQQGVDSLIKLNGIFAFSVYDKYERKLWLMRDRMGVKPLYYRLDATGLAFASEIKGVHALTSHALTCNVAGLNEWLYYGNSLGDRTLYRDIKQLLPGSYLELDLTTFECVEQKYWTLEEQAAIPASGSEPNKCMVSETRRLLELAVQRQIVSDVPVGIFLSGGIDSSAIAAFASRHYKGRLATYSVGFDFAKNGSELPKARRVAALCHTDHNELYISGKDIGNLVEKMVLHHGMPFSDAANIPLYLMAERIKGHTKVVLQGDGGDELFGGYRRYTTLRYYRLLHPLAKLLRRVHSYAPESAQYHRIQRYLSAFSAADLTTTIALLVTAENQQSKPSDIFMPSFSREIDKADPFERFRSLHEVCRHYDIGNQMSLIDLLVVLPDIYLEKVDRSTMAASLEVRVPFLDNDLVEYAVSLPGNSKMPFGRKKWLLKTALKGIIPDEILLGPKTGFGVPYGQWLQTSLKALFFDHLATFSRTQPDVLNIEHVKHLFSRTEAGLQNHSSLLWKTLNLLIWANSTNIIFSEQNIN